MAVGIWQAKPEAVHRASLKTSHAGNALLDDDDGLWPGRAADMADAVFILIEDGIDRTDKSTSAAVNATSRVDGMELTTLTEDGGYWTNVDTGGAACAVLSDDVAHDGGSSWGSSSGGRLREAIVSGVGMPVAGSHPMA